MDLSSYNFSALALLAILLAASGIAVATLGARQEQTHRAIRRRAWAVALVPERPTAPHGLFARWIDRLGRVALRGEGSGGELGRLAVAAGFHGPDAPTRIAALRVMTAIAGGAAGWGVAEARGAGVDFTMLCAAGGAFAGVMVPKIALRRLAARRAVRVARQLPFFIDSMLLMLRGGASIGQSLRQVAELDRQAMPEMQGVLRRLIDDVDRGMDTGQSLDRFADRLSIEPARDVADILKQGIDHGSEVSRPLHDYAALMIDRRLLSARETAGRRATHLTVVMMAFFMPPLLILLAAPAMTRLAAMAGGFLK